MAITTLENSTPSQAASRRPRRRSARTNVELTDSTYTALRQLADIRGKPLNGTIFDLAHAELARLEGRSRDDFLPKPFRLFEDRAGEPQFFLIHPGLGSTALTLPEFQHVVELADTRKARPDPQFFLTRTAGIQVGCVRHGRGVHLHVGDSYANLTHEEAAAFVKALRKVAARHAIGTLGA